MEDETGEAVYGAVQKAADELRAAGADFVIVLGRVGAGYENPFGDGRIVFVSPES